MTVAELITKLQQVPQELPVFRDWSGQLVPIEDVEVIDVKEYGRGSRWVDYFPEAELDEDERRFKGVQIG